MNTLNFIRSCQNTPGKLDKVELITDFISKMGDEEEFLMRNLLDPDINFNFSSKMIEKSKDITYSCWDLTIKQFLEKTASGELSGNEALEAYAGMREHAIDEEYMELLDIILTAETVGFSLKTFNKVYKKIHKKDFVSLFECQLADKYNPEKKYKNEIWYVTEKLDGLRAVYHTKQGKILTRSNKPVHGFEHIEKDLAKFCDRYNLDYCDGEFYAHHVPFQQIQGIVMKDDHSDKRYVKFCMFAVVGKDITSTEKMYEVMSIPKSPISTLDKFGLWICPLEPVIIRNNKEEIMTMCDKYMDDGYEGAMLRSASASYHFGRSRDLLKVKLFCEDDFEIVNFYEGKDRLAGTLGGFVLTNAKKSISVSISENVDFELRTIFFKCGSGFGDAQRAEFWKDRENLIGKTVNIKYQGLTDENVALRFPIFLGFKEDR